MKKLRKRMKNRLSNGGENLETRCMMHGGVDTSIDFDDLLPGTSYVVGDSFVADDTGAQATISAERFEWSDGTLFGGGGLNVDNRMFAGHLGQDINLNNITAKFDFGSSVNGLSLNFGEFGGNVNVQVNNDFYNVENFGELDGVVTTDGVLIRVPVGGHGFEFDFGEMVLDGVVHEFRIGGQELWVDHVHPGEPVDVGHPTDSQECIDFEDLRLGAVFGVGDTFVADLAGFQAKITGRPFTYSGGGMTVGGSARVEAGGNAGHLGQEMAVNNILLDFDFGGPVDGLMLDFGEHGGNLNIMINGAFVNFEDFQDIDGTTIGGVHVSVPSGGMGHDSGTLKLQGTVEQFAIGGQEFWIDHICPCEPVVQRDCIDFEDLIATKEYFVGDMFLADNTGLQANIDVEDFLFSDGTSFAGGYARVDTAGAAGHVGQDLMVNNVNLDFNFANPLGGLSLHFGEYGGNLNLTVNGAFHNFQDFTDINGAVIGGVVVTVPVGGFGNDTGRLELNGPIHSFAVGGQELWIDHVCVRETDQQQRLDWGDAPDQPYPTLSGHDGARHQIVAGYHLGNTIDPEPNGQPTPGARGDDFDGNDDDDGVRFLSPISPGTVTRIAVDATAMGHLDAWADFDQDGVWKPHEQIFVSEPIVAGTNYLSFHVPDSATPNPTDPTYLRFRFSRTGGLTPEGFAASGEVEDYAVLRGDVNQDGTIDADDIDRLWAAIASGSNAASHDLNGDGTVDRDDHVVLVEDILQTHYGDANLDGRVDANDLNTVALNWQMGLGGWSRGDFNCDGTVDAGDLNLLGANWGSTSVRAPRAPLAAALEVAPAEPSTDSSAAVIQDAATGKRTDGDRIARRRIGRRTGHLFQVFTVPLPQIGAVGLGQHADAKNIDELAMRHVFGRSRFRPHATRSAPIPPATAYGPTIDLR